MLDFVAVAMFGILALLAASIWLVRRRRAYQWHKRLQLALAATLAIAVTAFEADMRINGWTHRARESAYFGTTNQPGPVFTALYIHLAFSISTTVLWVFVIGGALLRFPRPPAPGAHSDHHRRWGWIAALDMLATGVSGWVFYWLAFVA